MAAFECKGSTFNSHQASALNNLNPFLLLSPFQHFTSMDKFKSVESHMELDCESDVEVDMDVSSVRSRRTAFTRSLAILDQVSSRATRDQHGPMPLMLNINLSYSLFTTNGVVLMLLLLELVSLHWSLVALQLYNGNGKAI